MGTDGLVCVISISHLLEAVVWKCSVKKGLIEILKNLQDNACARVSFFIQLQAEPAITLFKKKTPGQVLSVEICQFLRQPVFYRTPPVAASNLLRYDHGVRHEMRISHNQTF